MGEDEVAEAAGFQLLPAREDEDDEGARTPRNPPLTPAMLRVKRLEVVQREDDALSDCESLTR